MKKSLSTIIKEDARHRKGRKERRMLKAGMQTITPELLACEQELAQDWLSPEDDNAWAYLHTFLAGERKGARHVYSGTRNFDKSGVACYAPPA